MKDLDQRIKRLELLEARAERRDLLATLPPGMRRALGKAELPELRRIISAMPQALPPEPSGAEMQRSRLQLPPEQALAMADLMGNVTHDAITETPTLLALGTPRIKPALSRGRRTRTPVAERQRTISAALPRKQAAAMRQAMGVGRETFGVVERGNTLMLGAPTEGGQ